MRVEVKHCPAVPTSNIVFESRLLDPWGFLLRDNEEDLANSFKIQATLRFESRIQEIVNCSASPLLKAGLSLEARLVFCSKGKIEWRQM